MPILMLRYGEGCQLRLRKSRKVLDFSIESEFDGHCPKELLFVIADRSLVSVPGL
jgi:hypothetical protein